MANALRQLGGVTGRRLYPNYAADIRARASYLPQIYAERDRTALEQEKLDLQQKTFQEGKEQAQLANKLAGVGLGIQGAMLIPQWRGLGASPSTPQSAPTDEGSGGGWYNALREHWLPTTVGGAAGGVAGAQIGGQIGGKKDEWWKAGGGAIGGGAGAYAASGGDPYSTAAGAILGGVIGGIF